MKDEQAIFNIITAVTTLGNFKSHKEWQQACDEAILCYYIYGDHHVRDPCNIFERVIIEEDTYKKKFPAKFVMALIEHLITCETCGQAYREWFPGDSKLIEGMLNGNT